MKLILLLLFGFISLASAQDTVATDASSVINKVVAQYKSMTSYSSNGTVVSDMEVNGNKINQTTTFSIKLKKPNMYLISWSQTAGMPQLQLPPQSGTVWSDGTQPYLYMGGLNAYSKIGDDEMALAGATGISGGAALTIPSLFLPALVDKNLNLSQLKNSTIEKVESIGGEDCYVLSGSSDTSKKESFWISKSRSLILKFERSYEAPEGGVKAAPDMSDADLEKFLRSMGQPVTDESKKQERDKMQHAKDSLKNSNVSGESIETQADISSTDLTANDFHFVPPNGATLKDALMGPQTEFTKPTVHPAAAGAVGTSSSYEIVEAPVVKVFSATDGDNKFVAYLVQWKGSDVIVSDPLARSNFKVGDTIKFMAQKTNGPGFSSLSFTFL
jgi:outer membrane lipoprotein-sorting protein